MKKVQQARGGTRRLTVLSLPSFSVSLFRPVWSTPVENVAVMSFRSPKGSDAVLAVDLDGTIIEPASGKK